MNHCWMVNNRAGATLFLAGEHENPHSLCLTPEAPHHRQFSVKCLLKFSYTTLDVPNMSVEDDEQTVPVSLRKSRGL